MSSEWRSVTFGEVVEFSSIKKSVSAAAIDSYISTENMIPNFGGVGEAASLPISGSVSHFEIGDTLFSNIRTYFLKVWRAQFEGTCSPDVLVFRPKNKHEMDSGYLHHICRWDTFTNYSVRTSKGVKMPRGDKDALARFDFQLPSLNEQVSISEILDSLDNQIAAFREINESIEAIAQAIFKSWFVDFDPVKAKAAGLVPGGIDEATAALFPDSFQNSALGLKPHAWPILTFKETVKITGGGTPKTAIAEYWNGEIPWFSVVDAPSPSDVFVIDTEKHITEAGLKGSSTKMLSEGTTIISARGTVGKLALTGVPMTMNQSCYGLKGLNGDSYFTFFSTKRLVEQLKQNAHGAIFDTITMDTLSTVYVSYPPEALIAKFEETLAPLMDSMKSNLHEIKTLSELRDTLLPRLISGKLRIPETQEAVEEMA